MFIFSPLYGAAQRVPQLGCPVHVEINPRRQEIILEIPRAERATDGGAGLRVG